MSVPLEGGRTLPNKAQTCQGHRTVIRKCGGVVMDQVKKVVNVAVEDAPPIARDRWDQTNVVRYTSHEKPERKIRVQ